MALSEWSYKNQNSSYQGKFQWVFVGKENLVWVSGEFKLQWLLTIYKTFPEHSGWKVNGTRLFGSFQRKISWSKGTSERVVLFFRTEYSKQKFVFHFFKAIFDTSFRPLRSFSSKWNWFVQMVNAIPGWNLPVLNFEYHLPKPWTDRFAHVNGKQPVSELT